MRPGSTYSLESQPSVSGACQVRPPVLPTPDSKARRFAASTEPNRTAPPLITRNSLLESRVLPSHIRKRTITHTQHKQRREGRGAAIRLYSIGQCAVQRSARPFVCLLSLMRRDVCARRVQLAIAAPRRDDTSRPDRCTHTHCELRGAVQCAAGALPVRL